jgi:electron transfer flavoprotein beta subunit
VSGLRVLACFKVTPDFEALRDADWASAARGVETRYVRRILNCFDESALELALRLADSRSESGCATELGALSIGGAEVEPHLKTLLALGYERAARVRLEAPGPEAPGAAATGSGAAGSDTLGAVATGSETLGAGLDLDFAPGVVAAIIARYASRVAHSDLVMLGCRSGPGDGGTVPFRVAEALGWPCLTQVTDVEPVDHERVRVTRETGAGTLRLTLRGPCVLAVGNALVSHLRVPTLRDRLARRDRPIAILGPTDLDVDVVAERRREGCVLTGLAPVDRSRPGVVIAGDTPHDKARSLFDTCLADLMETL